MTPQEGLKFIEDNKEAIKLLHLKMMELDSVSDIKDNIEATVLGRQLAIETIMEWLQEIFSISRADWETLKEDDDFINHYGDEQVESSR